MTLEELKAFEASHPQYAPLFPLIMKEFDATVKEEFSKAFAAINEKMKKEPLKPQADITSRRKTSKSSAKHLQNS